MSKQKFSEILGVVTSVWLKLKNSFWVVVLDPFYHLNTVFVNVKLTTGIILGKLQIIELSFQIKIVLCPVNI